MSSAPEQSQWAESLSAEELSNTARREALSVKDQQQTWDSWDTSLRKSTSDALQLLEDSISGR